MSSRRPNRISPRALWSTGSIRLALIFSIIFGLGGALLVTAVEFGLYRFVEAEVRGDLNHQMTVMREDEARLGGDALVATLAAQARNHEARRYLFLIVAPDGTTFSNGLTRSAVNDRGFRQNYATKGRAPRWPDQRPNMLVLSHTTPGGTLLAIGRDTQHLDELLGGIRSFTLWSSVSAIGLALVAGVVPAYLFLRRLDRVNRAVDRISSGDASGRLPAIGFGREFDDLARGLNRMLERQEAMMDALKTVSEGIAHDLRTPLGRLRNRLEELEMHLDNPVQRLADIDLAMQEIDQITALFESLLALSRIETGTIAATSAPVDAAAILVGVGEIYLPVAQEAGGALRVATPPFGPLLVQGDANLLRQALSNLVENSLIHGSGKPDILLEATQNGDRVVLAVADRGPGIAPEEYEKVVKRFYRIDRSRTRSGSGIGLAMCAAVANWHKGEIRLSDNQPGLRVELALPALAAPLTSGKKDR